MEPYEAYTGTTVRVKQRHRRRSLRGMVGTVEHSWGDPTFPALDVRLENGRTELFWFHELDRVNGPYQN